MANSHLPPSPSRHYDKYTYSTRRRPENESPPRERLGNSWRTPGRTHPPTEYEACVAGIAPLPKTPDGFAIAEDGTLMSRFCSPSRYGAPAVALVSIPVTVVARERQQGSGPGAVASTNVIAYAPRGALDSSAIAAAFPEVDCWKKLCIAAGRDFSERELLDVTWDTLAQLLRHYGFTNPVENAKIQLVWKGKNGLEGSSTGGGVSMNASPSHAYALLPSDRSGAAANGDSKFYIPVSALQSPQATTLIASPNRQFERPLSPRRQGNESARVVPEYKRPLKWENVEPKVDTGAKRRAGSRSPARAGTGK